MKVNTIVLVTVFSLTFSCNIAKGEFDLSSIRYTKAASEADHEHYLAIAERFQYIEKYTKNTINSAFKKILPYVMEYMETVKINVSQECMKNSLALMIGIKNIKPWAFKFLDASGKVPEGMMYGSATAMGHYDECLGIEVKSTSKKDSGKKLFQGQYCVVEARARIYIEKPKAIYMLDFSPELQKIMQKEDSIFAKYARFIYVAHLGAMNIGVCVPSGCTKEDINSVLDAVQGNASLAKVTALTCRIKEENTYSTSQILVMAYYSLIILLVLVASGAEYYISHKNIVVKGKAIRCLLAFSFYTNFRKFCAPSQSKGSVRCLNGMKFWGIVWIFIGHSVASGMGAFTHGIVRYEPYLTGMPFQAILNAMISVDTFFLIGAFLSSYLTTKYVIIGKKKFNALFYVVHRLWRIYPTYIVLLTSSLMMPLMNSGPWYKENSGVITDPCYKYWWRHLLFINNFFDPQDTCFLHTWYLTLDVQLYILSLIIILPLIRWPKVGLSLLFFSIAGTVLYTMVNTYVNEWPPMMLFSMMDIDETIELWRYLYFVPWTHAGPYAIGLLIGYIYAMNPNVKMSRLTQVVGWCIAFTCSFSVLYGSRDWYERPMSRYLGAVYGGLSRTVWSLGPAWIIYASATGHGGIINWILSLRVFTHLGRLSFCAYIVHLIPITVAYSGVKTRVQADLYLPVWFFFGVLCISFALAFILHLFVEIPFANLESIFFSSAMNPTENTPKEENNVEEEFKNVKNGGVLIMMPPLNGSSTKL